MPIVESNAARATAQRATTTSSTASTTAATATGATGSGLDAVFAQMIAALEASTGLSLGSTTAKTTAATGTDTTSTDTSSDTKTATNDKAATDLAGALAMLVQGTHVDLATTGGLASPASLGAQTAAVSATSAAKAGLDALQTAPATATVSTAGATDATAAAASTTATPATTDAATALAATMTAVTDGTTGSASSGSDAKAQADANAQTNSTQTTLDSLGLQSLIARRTAPEKANGAGTPQVYGRPAARRADAATDKPTTGELAKLATAVHGLHGLEDDIEAVTTDATTDTGKNADGTPHAVVADIGAVAAHGADAPPPVDASAQTVQVGAIAAPGHHGTTDATTTDRADTTPTVHTVPVSAVADTIASHAKGGSSHFAIKLDPGELGSIDVRVEVKSSGEVRAHLIVERADTLDMMMRDQKTLERSLGDAGLDVGSSGLQFSLKDQNNGRSTPERAQTTADNTIKVEEPTAVTPDLAAIAYRARRAGGLDLRI